jgi:hypothetical protein
MFSLIWNLWFEQEIDIFNLGMPDAWFLWPGLLLYQVGHACDNNNGSYPL